MAEIRITDEIMEKIKKQFVEPAQEYPYWVQFRIANAILGTAILEEYLVNVEKKED